MDIRDAEDGDLEAVMSIYNHAVEHTTAIWNDAKVDLANRRAWLADRRRAGYPVLVAVADDGGILGYASLGTGAPLMAIVIRLNILSMFVPTSGAVVLVGR